MAMAKPAAMPIASTCTVSRKMSRRMLDRSAPNAMRMPISPVRCATP